MCGAFAMPATSLATHFARYTSHTGPSPGHTLSHFIHCISSCLSHPALPLAPPGSEKSFTIRVLARNSVPIPPLQVKCAKDISDASRLLFPGVGACGQAMQALKDLGYADALKEYINQDRPFLGICLGLQLLFDGSDENGGVEGLGIIPGQITRFTAAPGLPVPHIGWNQLNIE